MVGYVINVSRDGLTGTLLAHNSDGTPWSFYEGVNYSGPPLSWQQRVSFTPNASQPWHADSVTPQLDGGGNPIFDVSTAQLNGPH